MPAKETDTSRRAGASRLGAFLQKEREEGTHPAVAALRARPRQREHQSRKALEYARIERGRMV